MNLKKIHLALLLFGGCTLFQSTVFSQENKKQTFPISVALTNHSWAFPFQEVFRMNPVYPGLSAGTEFYYKNGEKFDFMQTAEIGGFINNSAGSGLYFNTNLGLRYTFDVGLFLGGEFGLGYFNSLYPSTTYTLDENGSYVKSNKFGVGALSSNFSMRIGYDLSRKHQKQISVFARYQWIASTYYWSLITIRPNGLLQLGITFHPFKNN